MIALGIAALKEAISIAGSQAELARRIRKPGRPIKQQHISNWINRDKKVPAEVVLDIEAATGVARHKLRSDIYPPERPARKPMPAKGNGRRTEEEKALP